MAREPFPYRLYKTNGPCSALRGRADNVVRDVVASADDLVVVEQIPAEVGKSGRCEILSDLHEDERLPSEYEGVSLPLR